MQKESFYEEDRLRGHRFCLLLPVVPKDMPRLKSPNQTAANRALLSLSTKCWGTAFCNVIKITLKNDSSITPSFNHFFLRQWEPSTQLYLPLQTITWPSAPETQPWDGLFIDFRGQNPIFLSNLSLYGLHGGQKELHTHFLKRYFLMWEWLETFACFPFFMSKFLFFLAQWFIPSLTWGQV